MGDDAEEREYIQKLRIARPDPGGREGERIRSPGASLLIHCSEGEREREREDEREKRKKTHSSAATASTEADESRLRLPSPSGSP